MTNKKTKNVKKVTPKSVKSVIQERDPHEIIQNFQKLLMTADNFGKPNVDTDYKQFWLGLRKNGPDMLGITKTILTELERSIEALQQSRIQIAKLTVEASDPQHYENVSRGTRKSYTDKQILDKNKATTLPTPKGDTASKPRGTRKSYTDKQILDKGKSKK
jgi:hypothetical protein|tara:strand:- start:8 stop:490 length:483 start_codon:yes stop_codon:yes gene_type:complete